jgi:DNA-binding CsgD family transcriptional regulator
MLTYAESPEVVSAAVKAGARGYLVHGNFTENELLQAVRMAAHGLGTFSAQAVLALSNPAPSKTALASRFGLSEREADVMELIAQGAANGEIARALFISEKTVKNHINKIFTKLSANNRGQRVPWLATIFEPGSGIGAAILGLIRFRPMSVSRNLRRLGTPGRPAPGSNCYRAPQNPDPERSQVKSTNEQLLQPLVCAAASSTRSGSSRPARAAWSTSA